MDEFCPRVKIEETVKEIGPLDIQHSNTINDDGSISKFWNDKNDTLRKMLGSVDQITEKFTGEDLRPAVEYEMKKKAASANG